MQKKKRTFLNLLYVFKKNSIQQILKEKPDRKKTQNSNLQVDIIVYKSRVFSSVLVTSDYKLWGNIPQ